MPRWMDRFKSPFGRAGATPVPMPDAAAPGVKLPRPSVPTRTLKERRGKAVFLNLTHKASDDTFRVMWQDELGMYIETVAREALPGFLCDFNPDFVMEFTMAKLGLSQAPANGGWFTFAPGQVVMMSGNIGSITNNTTGRLNAPLGINPNNNNMADSNERKRIQEEIVEIGSKVVLQRSDLGTRTCGGSNANKYFPDAKDEKGQPIVGKVVRRDYVWNGDDNQFAVRIEWPNGDDSGVLVFTYDCPLDRRELFSLKEWMEMQNSKLADELVDIKTEELDKVILPHEGKRSILAVIKQHQHRKKIFEEWGLGSVMEYGRGMTMLFWGPPGTGKTWASQCIAKAMGKKLNILDNAKLQSSVPGEMERNLKAEFAQAARDKAILMLDECDSLLMKRDGMGMILSSEINCLLTEIEKFEGMVILTTNRVGELDKALERRISLVVNFPPPDLEQRVQIWKRFLPEKLPVGAEVTAEKLAEVELTGGLIKNVVLNAARLAVSEDCERVELAHFERAVCMSEDGNKAFRKKSKVLHGTVDPSPQMGGGAVSLVKRMREELDTDEEKVMEPVAAAPEDSKKKETDPS